MKKNDVIENILIKKVGYEGIGIAEFHDGKKLIIKGWALPGMVCDLRVVKNYKDYAECHIVQIHSFPSDYELSNIKCPHYLYNQNKIAECKSGCGGCKWQIASYDQQLWLKYDIVKDSFRHYPHELHIEQVLWSPEVWGYRNKIEYSFGKFISWRAEEKQILSDRSLGFHRQGMFWKIVDIDQCFLVDTKVNQVFQYCKKIFADSGMDVYDQVQHAGVLRHLMIRQAKRMDQIMLILSVHSKFKSEDERIWIIDKLKNDQFLRDKVTTFVLIINDSLADVVATRDSLFEVLWWEGIINETLSLHVDENTYELNFDISPLSFFQTNSTGSELLYSTAIALSKTALWEDKDGTIMDLYCGTGTIWLSFLKSWIWTKLIGVEEIPSAIEDAKKNAKRNGIISDYHFFAGKAEKLLSFENKELIIDGWNENWWLRIDNWELKMVIVDPPRCGLHEHVIKLLIMLKNFNPSLKICYISCNPVTLARDMKLLLENYKADTIHPIDMFPHTHHIENIALLY